MKTIKITTTVIVFMLVLVTVMVLSACATAASLDVPASRAEVETADKPVTYKEFTLPGQEEISFELPEDWDFWANAGYLSPNDGKVYAGVRLAWIKAGQHCPRKRDRHGWRPGDPSLYRRSHLD